jgi:hypothetical protein
MGTIFSSCTSFGFTYHPENHEAGHTNASIGVAIVLNGRETCPIHNGIWITQRTGSCGICKPRYVQIDCKVCIQACGGGGATSSFLYSQPTGPGGSLVRQKSVTTEKTLYSAGKYRVDNNDDDVDTNDDDSVLIMMVLMMVMIIIMMMMMVMMMIVVLIFVIMAIVYDDDNEDDDD